MVLNRSYCGRNAPRWLPLLLDIVLATLSLLLDVRDLWFKLQWIGPLDTFSFSTVYIKSLPASNAVPLQSTASFSYANQKLQRDSGWSSFLEKCESLLPLLEEDNTRGFRHAVGKNCQIGSSTSTARAIEVFLTSSIRVDSMTWAACELLYKHRKPPICYSPIVTHDAETELIELLEVISQSTPISATVCVEGFIIKGPGMYSTLIYGCGSPSFYRSVLFASSTSKASQFLRDKAWLTSDSLGFMGMTLFIRENHRTIFILHGATKSNGDRILEHRSMRNISASGSLYISMIMADLALLAFSIRSVVEISRYMMWALWKPLVASEYQISSAQTTRMGFGVEDYTR
ncbi:uncharacterized protein PITG_16134 [Phytophthora infestans T30-4]|uniref:Transmembrane protein n=1 Tax=Phytophthora infestans (strain T30-4) TaxID=403677 RepID=D0NSZ2_PHYIT|nr:uncharacterized protein PITG_16134 [Phytophthora infestans T30-4]EEY64704.1 conserved hypothetical protein [Phytophthora infestans T30-4]|eukprot:XP_002897904.1 conserved hypothetical protein [Phytophthora infestans T30-4]